MKGQGGPFEIVGSYGKLIFMIGFVIVILLVFLIYVNSNPELGVSLPPLFGGGE